MKLLPQKKKIMHFKNWKGLLLNNQLRLFSKDIFFNTIAFGLVILAQHIIVLPILARHLDENTFANSILFVTILNFISLILGNDIGNTKMILNSEYKSSGIEGDFKRILLMSMPLCILASFIASLFLAEDLISKLMIIFTISIANIKSYIIAEFRRNKDFNKIFVLNTVYLAFVCIGISLFFLTKLYSIPFFAAEIASFAYSLRASKFIHETFRKTFKIKKSLLGKRRTIRGKL